MLSGIILARDEDEQREDTWNAAHSIPRGTLRLGWPSEVSGIKARDPGLCNQLWEGLQGGGQVLERDSESCQQ